MVFEIFIEQMKDLMNVKLFLEKNMLWWAAYIVITLVKISQGKPFVFLRKVSAPEKHG